VVSGHRPRSPSPTTSALTPPSTSAPETVAQKIVANLRNLGATRFDLKFGMPGLTHEQVMTTIALCGTRVIPRVRELLDGEETATAPSASAP
jgi:hypothetical protein